MTAYVRIEPAEAPESPHELRKAGDAFRGKYIDKCALVEQWAVAILTAAGQKTRLNQPFGQKLRAIRDLASGEPSLFKAPDRVLCHLDGFEPFLALRARLAHAIQTTAQIHDRADVVVFTSVHGSALDRLSVILSKEEMTRLLGELAKVAKELADQRLKG
jgi:hypothetical protein